MLSSKFNGNSNFKKVIGKLANLKTSCKSRNLNICSSPLNKVISNPFILIAPIKVFLKYPLKLRVLQYNYHQ